MDRPDLKLASAALQGLKSKPEALKRFDVALTELQHDLGVEMDEGTFRYVLNALVNQKVFAGIDPVKEQDKVRLPGNFQILAAIKAEM